ncbi:hypothetical protein ES708_22366 [subsurface metagenome]
MRKLDKLECRKKIIAILIKFQEDEQMTVQETVDQIVDQIVEVELPEKV